MRSKKIVAIASGLLLTGCTTTTMHGFREKAPVLSQDTQKSVTEIAGCVTALTDWGQPPAFAPKPTGGTITVFSQIPVLIIDIDDQGRFRHVTIRMFKTVWAKQNEHHLDDIRKCL